MRFSIFPSLDLWKLNPRRWLTCLVQACAAAGGPAAADISGFLPRNLTDSQRAAPFSPVPLSGDPQESAYQPAQGNFSPGRDRAARRPPVQSPRRFEGEIRTDFRLAACFPPERTRGAVAGTDNSQHGNGLANHRYRPRFLP